MNDYHRLSAVIVFSLAAVTIVMGEMQLPGTARFVPVDQTTPIEIVRDSTLPIRALRPVALK